MARTWLWVICFGFAIGASGQKDPADPVQGPASGTLELTPSTIDFGSQPAETQSPPRTATLTNHSNQNVNLRDVAVSGIDFSESDTCPPVLTTGAVCTISVTFTPAITGERLGTVLVATDSRSSLFLVLMGTGE